MKTARRIILISVGMALKWIGKCSGKGSFICKTLSDRVSEAWAQTEEG